jgi:hypothetical protein
MNTYGLLFWGTASALLAMPAAIANLYPLPETGIEATRECIVATFVKNRFEVSSSNTTRFRGVVTGTLSKDMGVTVVFSSDKTATLSFDGLGRELTIPVSGNALVGAQELTNKISINCLH